MAEVPKAEEQKILNEYQELVSKAKKHLKSIPKLCTTGKHEEWKLEIASLSKNHVALKHVLHVQAEKVTVVCKSAISQIPCWFLTFECLQIRLKHLQLTHC